MNEKKLNSVEVIVTWSDGEEKVFHYSTFFHPNLPRLFGLLRRQVWTYLTQSR